MVVHEGVFSGDRVAHDDVTRAAARGPANQSLARGGESVLAVEECAPATHEIGELDSGCDPVRGGTRFEIGDGSALVEMEDPGSFDAHWIVENEKGAGD